MDSSIIVTSLGIGVAIFAGLIIFWFFNAFVKRKLGTDQSVQLATPSQKSYWEEKRQHPRVPISWAAMLEPPYEDLKIQLKDISLGGAFVVCRKPLPLKEKIRLCLKIPDQEELLLNAQVIWSNSNVPQEKVINRGMGIKFVQNTNKARQRLEKAISMHLKQNNTKTV
ncbi:MAG: PilZ domain-containing protein [Desulfobacterales bacterium]|nr:PilZ domain-containing protein [Desulfobacterales bacterium]